MIAVTRLDGRLLLLNDDLIESIELTPDTMVSLTNGNKMMLRDAPDELVQRIIEFRRAIAPERSLNPGGER